MQDVTNIVKEQREQERGRVLTPSHGREQGILGRWGMMLQ